MNHRLFEHKPHSTRAIPRLLRAIEEARGLILSPDPPHDQEQCSDLSKFLEYREKNVMKIFTTTDPSPWYKKWREVTYRKLVEHYDSIYEDIKIQPVERDHHKFQVTTQSSELSHPSNSYSFKVSGLEPETQYIVGLRFNADPTEAYTFRHEMGALVPYDMVHPDHLSSMEVRLEKQFGGDLENGSIDFCGLMFGGCYSSLKNSENSNVILLAVHRKWTPIISLYQNEGSHLIREFQFDEMEFISKFPYEQYQIFARSRENLEEDNRRYQEEKFRRLAIDIRQLEGLAKTAKLWERKEQEQPKFPGQPFNMFPGPEEDGTIMVSIRKHVYMFENREEFQTKIRNYRLFVMEESMKKKIESETRGQRGNPEEEDNMEEEDEEEQKKVVRKAEKRKASAKPRSDKKKLNISPALARFQEEWEKKKFKEEEARKSMWNSVPIPCGTRGDSIGLESEWSTSDSTRTSVSPAFFPSSSTLRC